MKLHIKPREVSAPMRWVTILLSVLAIATVLGLAACGSQEVTFTGYWEGMGETDGLIRIDRKGDAYTIVGFGDPVSARLENDKLIVPSTIGQLSLSLSADGKTLNVSAGSSGAFALKRPSEPDAQLEQWIAAQSNMANDAAVKEGIHSLQVGVQSWAIDHSDTYPSVRVVRPDNKKFASYVDRWPINPFTDAPMTPGSQRGDYTYTLHGGRFTLSGHLSDGNDYTVP